MTDMAHFHSHKHTELSANTSVRMLYICLAINLIFVAAEAFAGWKSNSTGLLSDAGHNLSDALGQLLSLAAIYLNRSGNKASQTVSRYITLVNGFLLLGAIALIVYESIDKIINPLEVNASAVIAVSSVAILINGLTAWLLMKGQGDDINIKAAYLHAATDALVSVSVVISGIIISTTGWNMIDPLLSLAVSIFIAFPTIKLIHTALKTIRNRQQHLQLQPDSLSVLLRIQYHLRHRDRFRN